MHTHEAGLLRDPRFATPAARVRMDNERALLEILEEWSVRRTADEILGLLQAFMGLGLIVGSASIGIVSARAVVERRQQIGMLRAIGYQRWMIQWSFLLEASFVALLGIGLGLFFGAGSVALLRWGVWGGRISRSEVLAFVLAVGMVFLLGLVDDILGVPPPSAPPPPPADPSRRGLAGCTAGPWGGSSGRHGYCRATFS